MLIKTNTITSWSEDDRPREKMLLKGKNALSDAELIAILIGTGTGSKTAVDLGRELLALVKGDLYEFGKLNVHKLCAIKGIGPSKAISILAALELGRRRNSTELEVRIKLSNSENVYQYLYPYFRDLDHEQFYIISLNRSNEVINLKQLSIGGMSSVVVDAKIVFRHAIEQKAHGIILAHNHPSGSKRPSELDIKLTKRMKHFGELVDLPVLEHIILTDNGYFSFADEGLL